MDLASIPRCPCGRRRIPNRDGILHALCSSCRHRRAAGLVRAVQLDPKCQDCGERIPWNGRGRVPLRCLAHRIAEKQRRDREHQRQRPAA